MGKEIPPESGTSRPWVSHKENQDGTGFTYYQTRCHYDREHLYQLCYAPSEEHMWFWNVVYDEVAVVRMRCVSWKQANMVQVMLTSKKYLKEPF